MPNIPSNNPIIDNLAHGFDWNDGKGGRAGTVTQAGQIVVHAANGAVLTKDVPTESLQDSPIMERAEQCTVTHHYRMGYFEAQQRISIYSRGALLSDSYGNFYRVLSSTIQRQTGGMALMTVVSESISFDVPPDEYCLNPVKLGLDIMKHPRYFYALMPTNQIPNFSGTSDTDEQINAKQVIIRAIQAYRENPFIPTSANINSMTGLLHDTIMAGLVSGKFVTIVNNPNFDPGKTPTGPDPIDTATPSANPPFYFEKVDINVSDPNNKIAMAMAAAKEIIGKLWRMEDSPMINGVELTWSEYYFRPPPLNLGGYIEDPVLANPGFPDYFYSTTSPPTPGNTIFDNLSFINPQCFSINGRNGGGTAISWLRDADTHEFQRTWFKVTRKWLGAPVGTWDADIYSSANRPSAPSDYRNLILA